MRLASHGWLKSVGKRPRLRRRFKVPGRLIRKSSRNRRLLRLRKIRRERGEIKSLLRRDNFTVSPGLMSDG